MTAETGQTYHPGTHEQHDAQTSVSQPANQESVWHASNGQEASPSVVDSDRPDSRRDLHQTIDYSDEEEFQWDEQDEVSGGHDYNRSTVLAEDESQDIKKAIDGMATLTVDAANYGYLGTASGASHLRSMWMETSGAPALQSGSRTEWQRQMLQLLRQSQKAKMTSFVHAQPFVTRAMSDVFVDAYFRLYHPTFPVLHEPTFRAQYANTTSYPNQGSWLVLANLVAAAGAFVSSTSCHDDTDLAIFKTTKQHLSVDCLEIGNLAMVQIFGLMAHYLQKRNKPNSGYSYGGLALRLAIGLGLHKELSGKKMTILAREMRRRIWWSLCVLDVGATITYSRPLTWPQEGVDAAFPSNVHEEVSPMLPTDTKRY